MTYNVFGGTLNLAQSINLQPASITSSGAFKPECNGLSQFTEDTGGPSTERKSERKTKTFLDGSQTHGQAST